MRAKLTPPDPLRCQTTWTEYRPFTMGGNVHQQFRCEKPPTVIATEKRPAADGLRGSMSLCAEHRKVFEQQSPGLATFKPVPQPRAPRPKRKGR